MPECNYCGSSFDDEGELVDHLVSDHDWEALSRIDRKRVETHAPTKSPEAGLGDRLSQYAGSIPGTEQLTRRRAIGLTGGLVTLGGAGVVADRWVFTESADTEQLQGQWEAGSSLPYLAEYPAVTGYEGELYIFGGADEENVPQSDAYKYNPEDDSWAELAPMPVEGQRITATRIGSYVFIIDGRTHQHTFGDGSVRIYEIENDTWTMGTTRPVTTRDAGQTTDGERIFTFGGSFGGESTDVAHAYDPDADRWEELSSLPFPNRQMSCHYVPSQEHIFMFGGEAPDGPTERDDVIAYDPETDSYDDSPTNMPEPSQTIPSTVHDGLVLFPGGEEPGATTGRRLFRVYDPEADAWGELPELIEMVEATDSAVIGNELFVPGGRTYLEPDADLDEEPHTYRYDDYPVFLDRMQIYRFEE